MKKLLRINFVLPGYTTVPIGGYRVIYEYANFLAERGHRVRIIFPMRLSRSVAQPSLLGSIKRPLWRMKTRLQNRPLIAWYAFHRTIRLCLVDAIIDGSIPDADVTAATAWATAARVSELEATKGAKFYIIQHHETMMGPPDEVNATWLLPLHKVAISQWLVDIGLALGADSLRHIPNGINFDLFTVTNEPARRQMHIISLFHDLPYKGVPEALAVLGRYHMLFPQVPVTMFGIPERTAEIPEWITYIQNPSQHVLVHDIYNRGTIYLSASRSEGWGLPPCEAMACGCAFVGTDIGGFRDFAKHGDTALLSAVGDTDGMLQNLISLTTDDARRNRIQQLGTQHIRQFTWDRAGLALEKFFVEKVNPPILSNNEQIGTATS